jgi:hypothetical protein
MQMNNLSRSHVEAQARFNRKMTVSVIVTASVVVIGGVGITAQRGRHPLTEPGATTTVCFSQDNWPADWKQPQYIAGGHPDVLFIKVVPMTREEDERVCITLDNTAQRPSTHAK